MYNLSIIITWCTPNNHVPDLTSRGQQRLRERHRQGTEKRIWRVYIRYLIWSEDRLWDRLVAGSELVTGAQHGRPPTPHPLQQHGRTKTWCNVCRPREGEVETEGGATMLAPSCSAVWQIKKISSFFFFSRPFLKFAFSKDYQSKICLKKIVLHNLENPPSAWTLLYKELQAGSVRQPQYGRGLGV